MKHIFIAHIEEGGLIINIKINKLGGEMGLYSSHTAKIFEVYTVKRDFYQFFSFSKSIEPNVKNVYEERAC